MVLKEQLLQACFSYVNKRISSYKDEIQTIKESIENNDSGSDEEDDSGNGKLFIDLEKNAQHLSDATKMYDLLKLINPKTTSEHIIQGSIVKTNSSNFFIATSVGKIEIDEVPYFVISLNSPIGQLLKNKTTGDSISFNENNYSIIDVK